MVECDGKSDGGITKLQVEHFGVLKHYIFNTYAAIGLHFCHRDTITVIYCTNIYCPYRCTLSG